MMKNKFYMLIADGNKLLKVKVLGEDFDNHSFIVNMDEQSDFVKSRWMYFTWAIVDKDTGIYVASKDDKDKCIKDYKNMRDYLEKVYKTDIHKIAIKDFLLMKEVNENDD